MKLRRITLLSSVILTAAMLVTIPVLAQRSKTPIRTDTKVTYHNGPVMQGQSNLYLIWYGNWNTTDDNYTRSIIGDFAANLGGTEYFQINAGYPDLNGISPSGALISSGHANDSYSQGASLSAQNIQSIVREQIVNSALPLDNNGIYIVLASADVHASVAGFCQPDGAPHHGAFTLNGTQVKYGFIDNPKRCPNVYPHLTWPGPTPNDDFAADGIANAMAAALSAIVTNPTGTGWFDRYGFENSTKCQGTFGTTFTAANGSQANIFLGQRHYLLQQNWVNARKGYCSLTAPTQCWLCFNFRL